LLIIDYFWISLQDCSCGEIFYVQSGIKVGLRPNSLVARTLSLQEKQQENHEEKQQDYEKFRQQKRGG
jgi:hypothetical protein